MLLKVCFWVVFVEMVKDDFFEGLVVNVFEEVLKQGNVIEEEFKVQVYIFMCYLDEFQKGVFVGYCIIEVKDGYCFF